MAIPSKPETRYARSGSLHIAYQVVGEGPVDLVFVPGFVSQVEQSWEEPDVARFFGRLADFSRLVIFDKRGTGLSDPVSAPPSLEERMDDVRAVMDAAGLEQAALFGISEGGPMSLLFAATYPQRVSALVLYGTTARFLRDEDYPWGATPEQLDRLCEEIGERWGSGMELTLFAPSLVNDAQARQRFGRFLRRSASPGMAQALVRMLAEIDVRSVLPAIRVPTLVVHRRDEVMVPLGAARYLAEHVPAAKCVELAGDEHLAWLGDVDALVNAAEQFLTGTRRVQQPDRVLATVLFTDIVDSTRHAARLGDRSWRSLLQAHDAAIRRELEHFEGREMATTGDGFLATFDGPARAIRCAMALHGAVESLGIRLRTGLHTGECELMGEQLGGIAVHIGARVAAVARPGEVLVSSTVKDLVAGSGLSFTERGSHELKGVPGSWKLFAVAT